MAIENMNKTIEIYGFHRDVTADEVKEFIENHTGDGSVSGVKISKPKDESSKFTFVTIEFTSRLAADHIVSLTTSSEEQLRFENSFLKARGASHEIVVEWRSDGGLGLERMEKLKLHLGCQISKERFSVLWKEENVCMEYGNGVRKLLFYFGNEDVDYKMELRFESILQVELHSPLDHQPSKLLVIQLQGAPRIFKKVSSKSSSSSQHYFTESGNLGFRWIRDIDFTQFSSIGQSSAFCLQFPQKIQLPNFFNTLFGFKETYGQFILEKGSSFSSNSNLVPIITPPTGFDFSYKILFKINSLIQHGYLPGSILNVDFFRLIDPCRFSNELIEYALDKLFNLKECCYEPEKWIKEQYLAFYSSKQIRPWKCDIDLDDGLVYVHRVQITPSKVYFRGPEANLSNRVVRHYIDDMDNFLRVSFVDEELDKIRSIDLSPRISTANCERTSVYDRILSTLRDGVVIGEKKFEFLAFSASQLRENSVWMFASREGLSAADIRQWMGDFSPIRNVAKYAARLGQSFGSSRKTLSVEECEIEVIPDVEIERNEMKYCFSDGIGKISETLAQMVAEKCSLNNHTPSAFQIRYAGYKGVVAVDPTSKKKLSLRKSMLKYTSLDTQLDVLAWSRYQPCFLNRQVINLLSTLGVEDFVFEKKQKEAIAQLDAILKDTSRALEVLELMSPGEMTSVLKEMLSCDYKPDEEPFLQMMLRTFRAVKLLDLRTKSRIFVPKGRTIMGCLDETRTLEYGQVFIQCSVPGRSSESNFVVKGKVVVAKNPCLHPGDVRLLNAVDVPALHHMVDCVVFPQKGKRPHPNECSGSDLDGDLYFVCWDPELTRIRPVKPMNYEPAPSMQLDHDVTIEEVQKYFAEYMVNDGLGTISNAHTVFADRKPKKAMSRECIKLAKLFSIAVDFPKTGIPANLPRPLRVHEYPDFMEKLDRPTYESNGVIGKLFRGVKDVSSDTNSIESFTREVATMCYDPDMEVDGFENYVSDAFDYKTRYDYKLGNLMAYYGIETEPELISGNILRMAKSFDKRTDLEQIGFAMKSLRKEAKAWFNDKGSKFSSDGENDEDEEYAKASAWYHVTYHPKYWGRYNEGLNRDHFLSFPWCVYDKLIQIKRNKICQRNSSPISSMIHRFRKLNFY